LLLVISNELIARLVVELLVVLVPDIGAQTKLDVEGGVVLFDGLSFVVKWNCQSREDEEHVV